MGGIWLSQGLIDAMNPDLAEYITAQLRHYTYHSTMCCALSEELPQIRLNVGLPDRILSTNLPNLELRIWNPPGAASETSPHFVFMGQNRRI
jgi:hypothetical protein